jgi:hypothetical protein
MVRDVVWFVTVGSNVSEEPVASIFMLECSFIVPIQITRGGRRYVFG